jgi:prefoldin subunit 5
VEFQESKREIIGFDEIKKERDERIEKLKKEVNDLTESLRVSERDLSTLTIHHDKLTEQHTVLKKDHDEAVERLRITNKVRNDTD